MVTANIDTNGLYLQMDALREALVSSGGDATTIVVDEARLLDRTIVNFVPPIRSEKWGSPQQSGKMAIRSELTSLFSEAEPRVIDEVGSVHGIHAIDTYVTGKDGSRVHVLWDNLDPLGERMKEYHEKYRNRRGKIKREKSGFPMAWKARVVVPQGSREPYIKAVEARSGRAKCSMAMFGMRVGDDYPTWIAKHKGGVSDISIVQVDTNAKYPQVTFGSRAPGIDRIRSRVQAAVNFRARVIGRRVRLILSDYKDWRKVRATADARRGKKTPGEVVE